MLVRVTVSIWRPHNHRVIPSETKCISYRQMTPFCVLDNGTYHSVNFSHRTASVLKSVLKWPGMKCAETSSWYGNSHKLGTVTWVNSSQPAHRVVIRSPRKNHAPRPHVVSDHDAIR